MTDLIPSMKNNGDTAKEMIMSNAPIQIIALHCSGANGGQWRKLAATLGPRYGVIAPSFIGCGDAGPWNGERAFTLADEARGIVDLIDAIAEPVHLIGHSYGGGVALKVAAARPRAVASLALYEPSAFHLLKQMGLRTPPELEEIEAIAEAVGKGLVTGSYQQAAAAFVNYWNGAGAWEGLRPDVQAGLLRWLPKAPLDFRALLEDDTPITAYRRITCPVSLVCGEHALAPSRRIVGELASALPRATVEIIPGAGHMGPVTHAVEVNACLAKHLAWAGRERAASLGEPVGIAA